MTKHFIHNAETGETVEIELTAKEVSDREAAEAARLAAKQAEEEAKVTARQSLMAKLGLTEEELKAVLS